MGTVGYSWDTVFTSSYEKSTCVFYPYHLLSLSPTSAFHRFIHSAGKKALHRNLHYNHDFSKFGGLLLGAPRPERKLQTSMPKERQIKEFKRSAVQDLTCPFFVQKCTKWRQRGGRLLNLILSYPFTFKKQLRYK